MSADNSSRYAQGTTAWVSHPYERSVQVVFSFPIQWNNYPFTRVQVTSADTLPSLAHKAYGSARDYWFIAAMNPRITCPDDLIAGDILHIPTGKLW